MLDMSDFRFFSKWNPRQTIFLSNGMSVKFTPVDHDNGVLATNNEQIIREFETMMQQHRGGITEITAEAYQEAKKKDFDISSDRRWREEISKGVPKPLPTPPSQSAVPVVGSTVPEVQPGDIQAIRPKASR